MAGGLTQNSDWKNVLLLRGGLSNPRYVELDVKEMLRGKDRRGDLLLEQGDIIYVASTPISRRRALHGADLDDPFADLQTASRSATSSGPSSGNAPHERTQ